MDGRDIRPRAVSELHVDETVISYTMSEWTFTTLNAVVAIQFLAGSALFFSWLKPWTVYVGDGLFVTGSLQYFAMCLTLAIDHREEIRRVADEVETMKDQRARDRAQKELDERGIELKESICYLVSSVVFMVGCVLFYPRLFNNESQRIQAQRIAAYLFVTGSSGFVLAACWSGVSLLKRIAEEEASAPNTVDEQLRNRLAAWEVTTSLAGSVLFVVGSVLYRPIYSASCNHQTIMEDPQNVVMTDEKSMPLARGFRRRGAIQFLTPMDPVYMGPEMDPAPGPGSQEVAPPVPADLRVLCVNLMNIGSLLYMVGSSFLLIRCLISFARLAWTDGQKQLPQAMGPPLPRSRSTSEGSVSGAS